MSKARDELGEKWLEYVSKVTNIDMETLENAKFICNKDCLPNVPDEFAQIMNASINGYVDQFCIVYKAFSSVIGKEKTKEIYKEAMIDFGYRETKIALREMGKEDEHSLDTLFDIMIQGDTMYNIKSGYFIISDKKGISTSKECPIVKRLKKHGIDELGICSTYASMEEGMIKAINPNFDVSVPACQLGAKDAAINPYCVYVFNVKE